MILLAGGAAHFLVIVLGHREHGGVMLIAAGAAVVIVILGIRWWRHRAPGRPLQALQEVPSFPDPGDRVSGDRLWRVRVAVADAPGGLAALAAALSEQGADIRSIQVHPGSTDAIDEFLITASMRVTNADLTAAVRRAGGRDQVIEPASAHELSDPTSRALTLSSALISADMSLEQALLGMSGAYRCRWRPDPPEGMAADDISGAVMSLAVTGRGSLVLERSGMPFTPFELARCTALVRVAGNLHRRLVSASLDGDIAGET